MKLKKGDNVKVMAGKDKVVAGSMMNKVRAITNGLVPETLRARQQAERVPYALLRDLIAQYCPEPVRDAIDRLYRADVQRWYA